MIPEGCKELKHDDFLPRNKNAQAKDLVVSANHHLIRCLPLFPIYTHEITIKVAPESRFDGHEAATVQQRARVLLKREIVEFFGDHYVFDGVSQVFSPQQIVPMGEGKKLVIDMDKRRDGMPNRIHLYIKNKGQLNVRSLGRYLSEQKFHENPAGIELIENPLKWIAAAFRKDPASRLATKPGGNAYFDRDRETTQALSSTRGVLEARRGTYQTIQLRFQRLSVNIDTCTTVWWVPNQCLLRAAAAICQTTMNDIQNVVLGKYKNTFHSMMRKMLGIVFHVRHLTDKGNSKRLKWKSLSNKNSEQTTFEERLQDGTSRMTSVKDYFKTKYNIVLKCPLLPLVCTSKGDFPLEVCFSAVDERYKEILQGSETADLIRFSTAPANKRKEQIDRCMRLMAHHQNNTLRAHGLVLDPIMMKVKAKVLPNPRIVYGQRKNMSPTDGSWNLRGLHFIKPATITSWVMVQVANGNNRPAKTDIVEGFCQKLAAQFNKTGMKVPKTPPPLIACSGQGQVANVVKAARAKATEVFGADPDVIFFLFVEVDTQLYQVIKQGMDLHVGIASQCMVQTKIKFDRPEQYIGNISMKVNVKLGGTNTAVYDPFWSTHGRTMLLGGDISHATPAQLRSPSPPPSLAALVGTWDKECTAYSAVASAQESTLAMINDVVPMFKELIRRYRERNDNLLPQRLIYYRDGVSESEFQAILDQEAYKMQALFKQTGTPCKMTVICAIKRHHTRFFPDTMGTKLGNVPCGTSVENSNTRNDAFIISHGDLQGTKRPTRYITLLDENSMTPEEFARITHNLNSSYARATRSVAIVPPIYYADQVAERSKLHLQTDPKTGALTLKQVHPKLKWAMYWQ